MSACIPPSDGNIYKYVPLAFKCVYSHFLHFSIFAKKSNICCELQVEASCIIMKHKIICSHAENVKCMCCQCIIFLPSTDLRQEMKIRRSDIPDNDKCLERVRSPVDSNKLKVEMETQTVVPDSPHKSKLTQANSRIKCTGISFNCWKR